MSSFSSSFAAGDFCPKNDSCWTTTFSLRGLLGEGLAGKGLAGAGFAAVLFDDDGDVVVFGDGPEFFESLDPEGVVAAAGVAEGEQLFDAGGLGLFYSVGEDVQGVFVFGVDGGEHHDGFEAGDSASLA